MSCLFNASGFGSGRLFYVSEKASFKAMLALLCDLSAYDYGCNVLIASFDVLIGGFEGFAMAEMDELFYRDAYVREFSTKVLSVAEGKKGFEVVLNDTAFYPEGGGQPADLGTLGGVKVTDVRRTDAGIVHYCEAPIEVGQVVEGVLDWERRFDNMQNHTGEHIFSGLVNQAFGFDNVGFHMDDDVITCDFSGVMTDEDVAEMERRTNEAIAENLEVEVLFPTQAELDAMDYRSKKALTGKVRIVDVPGCDRCACCGVHVKRTGEIGCLKVLSSMKHRGGTRITFVCGLRALRDYDARVRETRTVSNLLSAKPLEISAAVERLQNELATKEAKVAELTKTIFTLKAQAIAVTNAPLVLVEDGLTPFELRNFCAMLAEAQKSPLIVVLSQTAAGVYSYVLACSDEMLRPWSTTLNKALNGRGGGAKGFVQGSFKADVDAIHQAVHELWASR